MKKVISILSLSFLLFASSIPVFAAEEVPINVYVDNEQLKFDKQPFIENDVTLVQFRPIFEKLGLKIEWDEKTRTVIGRRSDLIVKLVIDSTSAVINDERRELVIAPRIVDGNTMVSLRFVSESSGKKVNWDGDTREIWVGERSGVKPTVTENTYDTTPMEGNSKFGKPVDVPTTPEVVKVDDKKTSLLTAQDIQTYLDETYNAKSPLKTVLTDVDFKVTITENDKKSVQYDYLISFHYDLSLVGAILAKEAGSIKNTNGERDAETSKQQIKTYIESMAKDIISKSPNKKMKGETASNGSYMYPNLKIGYSRNVDNVWANYTFIAGLSPSFAQYDSPLTNYNETVISTFKWAPKK